MTPARIGILGSVSSAINPMLAKLNPRKTLPVSPKNTEAGAQFRKRNPKLSGRCFCSPNRIETETLAVDDQVIENHLILGGDLSSPG